LIEISPLWNYGEDKLWFTMDQVNYDACRNNILFNWWLRLSFKGYNWGSWDEEYFKYVWGGIKTIYQFSKINNFSNRNALVCMLCFETGSIWSYRTWLSIVRKPFLVLLILRIEFERRLTPKVVTDSFTLWWIPNFVNNILRRSSSLQILCCH
jgi:hypothetical protein